MGGKGSLILWYVDKTGWDSKERKRVRRKWVLTASTDALLAVEVLEYHYVVYPLPAHVPESILLAMDVLCLFSWLLL